MYNFYEDPSNLDPRLLNEEEEPPSAKLVDLRVSFWFAWLFWFIAMSIGVPAAMITTNNIHLGLGIPLDILVIFLVSVVGGLLLALVTMFITKGRRIV